MSHDSDAIFPPSSAYSSYTGLHLGFEANAPDPRGLCREYANRTMLEHAKLYAQDREIPEGAEVRDVVVKVGDEERVFTWSEFEEWIA